MTISVDSDNPALDIIIPKLDFQSQMKMAQLNKRLANVVQINAEYELRKFQRHIRDDRFMWVNIPITIDFII